jgi:hypothetical protein
VEPKPEEQAQVEESCPPLSGYALKIAALAVYVTHNGYIAYEEKAGEEISLDEALEIAQDLSCAAQDTALEVGDALVEYADALYTAEVGPEGMVPDDFARRQAEGVVGRITADALTTLAGELGVGGAVIDAEAVRESLVDYMTHNEQAIKEAVEAAKHD